MFTNLKVLLAAAMLIFPSAAASQIVDERTWHLQNAGPIIAEFEAIEIRERRNLKLPRSQAEKFCLPSGATPGRRAYYTAILNIDQNTEITREWVWFKLRPVIWDQIVPKTCPNAFMADVAFYMAGFDIASGAYPYRIDSIGDITVRHGRDRNGRMVPNDTTYVFENGSDTSNMRGFGNVSRLSTPILAVTFINRDRLSQASLDNMDSDLDFRLEQANSSCCGASYFERDWDPYLNSRYWLDGAEVASFQGRLEQIRDDIRIASDRISENELGDLANNKDFLALAILSALGKAAGEAQASRRRSCTGTLPGCQWGFMNDAAIIQMIP